MTVHVRIEQKWPHAANGIAASRGTMKRSFIDGVRVVLWIILSALQLWRGDLSLVDCAMIISEILRILAPYWSIWSAPRK
jgi:hypothetical protein